VLSKYYEVKHMKIAISATGTSLDDQVDSRLGRAQYFLIVDTETMDFHAIENSNAMAGGGAGIQTAQMLAQENVETVLTGNCGPNAFQVFGAAGVQVIVGVSGIIREAINKYKSGELSKARQPNVGSHFGSGGSMGSGGGMGRGMGKGRK
jgi:predicted Fe-Mo cluster-binding NifX family protein